MLCSKFIDKYGLDDHIKGICDLYRDNCQTMIAEMEKHFPENVKFTRPEGGLFLFLTMPEGFDAVRFYDKALDAGVAYVAGEFFHPDRSGKNTMRINFSFMDHDKITEGVKLLARLLKDEIL